MQPEPLAIRTGCRAPLPCGRTQAEGATMPYPNLNSGEWQLCLSKSDAIRVVFDRTDWDWQDCEAWLDAQIASGALPAKMNDSFLARDLRKLDGLLDGGAAPSTMGAALPVEVPKSGRASESDLRRWIARNIELPEREAWPSRIEQELGGKVSRDQYRAIRREIAGQQGIKLEPGRPKA